MYGWKPQKSTKPDENDTKTLSHHPYVLYHFATTYTNMLCVCQQLLTDVPRFQYATAHPQQPLNFALCICFLLLYLLQHHTLSLELKVCYYCCNCRMATQCCWNFTYMLIALSTHDLLKQQWHYIIQYFLYVFPLFVLYLALELIIVHFTSHDDIFRCIV